MSYPNYERDEIISRRLAAADLALRAIANYADCMNQDYPDPEQPICQCPVCIAKRTLASESEWRYVGNHESRRSHNPREAAIADAWRRYMKGPCSGTPDHKLASILGIDKVTPHDWLIATTLVQWMATNIGSCLLYEAGYHYDPPKPPTEVK